MEQACRLIRDNDPVRFARIQRDLKRIWSLMLMGNPGEYVHATATCRLERRYLTDDATPLVEIASTIVHEATHARLDACGFGYEEEDRRRIEHVCFRREVAFGRRLPDGADVIERAEQYLNSGYTFSDAEMNEWRNKGTEAALKELGAPNWLISIVLFFKKRRDERAERRKRRKA